MQSSFHEYISTLYKAQLVHLPGGGTMPCNAIHSGKPCTWIHLALLALSIIVSSGWTCSAIFISCQGVGQPHITALSPDSVPADAESVPLGVEGNDFTPQSQITWNGNVLATRMVDSHHLQTAITQQTFESFWRIIGRQCANFGIFQWIWGVRSGRILPWYFSPYLKVA